MSLAELNQVQVCARIFERSTAQQCAAQTFRRFSKVFWLFYQKTSVTFFHGWQKSSELGDFALKTKKEQSKLFFGKSSLVQKKHIVSWTRKSTGDHQCRLRVLVWLLWTAFFVVLAFKLAHSEKISVCSGLVLNNESGIDIIETDSRPSSSALTEECHCKFWLLISFRIVYIPKFVTHFIHFIFVLTWKFPLTYLLNLISVCTRIVGVS